MRSYVIYAMIVVNYVITYFSLRYIKISFTFQFPLRYNDISIKFPLYYTT